MHTALSTKRVPVLDGWRALMLFMISWYHIWQQSWLSPSFSAGGFAISFEPYVRTGYMMVDGIILLSAFVLFLPYARCMVSGGELPRPGAFYLRRAARIMPSYYVYLIAMLFLSPFGTYGTPAKMWTDLLRHVTFTHTAFRESYLYSPVGMAVWTLAVEAQAYLIFPLLAFCAVKKPWLCWPLMIGAGFWYRGLMMRQLSDYAMVMNQLPAFLDVYALGMALALLYVWLVPHVEGKTLLQAGFTMLAVVFLLLLLFLMREQVREQGQAAIQLGQMKRRFPLALCFSGLFLSSALSLKGVRGTLGSRVMTFLAGVTLNYYMWHPAVAQLLKRWRIPPYVSPMPQQAGEMPWQTQYTYLCFALSLLAAVVLTYAVERPLGKIMLNLRFNKRRTTL